MKNTRRWLSILTLLMFLPTFVLADMARGDMVVTLGENLTEEQKSMLLSEMDAPNDVEIVVVTNAEEHKYLDDYVPKRMIGTKAISSSAITIGAKDSGLQVKTKNITWVTDDMYRNALTTAGLKDAEVYITAPFEVSGTAALTGLIKAYELTTDEVIPEETKQAANEEMVKTAELGDEIGTDKAADLIKGIKEELAQNTPETDEQLQAIIEKVAKDLGISLTDKQLQSLLDLFKKLQELDIDWKQVGNQISEAKEKVTKYLSSEEGQSFLDKLKDFFVSLIDAIKSFFA